MTPRTFFLATLGCAAALRLLLVFFTPALFAPDEAGHLLYIHEIAIHHVLPVQTLDGIWANNNGAEDFYHTPLYYLLLSPIYRLFWPAHAVLYVLRLTSVAFGLTTVVLIRSIVREHFPDSPWAAELAALFAAFQPVFVAVTSSVNNDALSLLLMVLVLQHLARLVRDGTSLSRLLLLSTLLSVAVYVKVSALVLFPAFLVAGVLVPARRTSDRALVLLPAACALGAILPWWVVRNQHAYGSLLALDMNWAVPTGPLYLRIIHETLWTAITFWFALGRRNEIINAPWIVILLSAVLYIVSRRLSTRWQFMSRSQRGALLLALVPLLLGFAQSLEYAINLGFSQGRYLLPGLTALSLIFGLGFAHADDPQQPPRRALAAGAVTTALWLLFLATIVAPGFAAVHVDHSVGGQTSQPAFHTGDLDTWVIHRTAATRAEDACFRTTQSRFSRRC